MIALPWLKLLPSLDLNLSVIWLTIVVSEIFSLFEEMKGTIHLVFAWKQHPSFK